MSNAPAAYGMNDYASSYSNSRPQQQQPYYPGSASRTTPPRTPSPSPSELEELHKPVIDFKAILNPRTYFQRKYIPWIIGIVVLGALVALLSIYHKQIVDWLTPVSNKLKNLPAGWVIPIAILFIISFPPLFGHEIVAVLCGVVWGLWVGFGIVAAGTFLGEVGNFYAFRYICSARGQKLERDNLSYACLAYIVRQGGFWIALVARFSAIPGHFTTAVFSTCGLGIIVFCIATTLSLPKQLITVYLGVIIKQTADGPEDTKSKIISDSVLAVSFVVTIAAAYWIYMKMAKAKPEVLRERRRARARKEWEKMRTGGGGPYGQSTQHLTSAERVDADNASVFNPNDSDEGGGYGYSSGSPYGAIPNASEPALVSVRPQRWDQHGRAIPDLERNAQRQDSAVAVGWDPRNDGGSTLPGPGPSPGMYDNIHRPPSFLPHPPGSQSQYAAQQQQNPNPNSYPPRGSSPMTAPPQNSYHDPYDSNQYQSHEPPMTAPLPSSSSTPSARPRFTSPPPSNSQPQSRHASPPPQHQQQPIPASVPRFELHDGPAPSVYSAAPPSVYSAAPSYKTYDPAPAPQQQQQSLPPRIPPPPSSSGTQSPRAY